MNFFCDSGGNIFHVDPENVYQGSANANTIYFIGAFASSCQVTVAFGLPNGVYTEPTLLTLVTDSETLSVNDKNGVKFNVWQVRLNGVVTENYGKVDLQFYVYGNGGNGQGACIASAYSSFEVSKGVPITLPDDTNYPEESLLAQILAQLQRLQAQAAASTEAIEENTEAIVEVQKALEDKIKEFNGNLSGADARLQAEANGEVTVISTSILGAAIDEVELTFDGYVMGVTLIDWGDGTIDSNLKHTYKADGTYLVKLYGVTEILGNFLAAYRVPNGFNGGTTLLKLGNALQTIKASAFADYVASETEELYIPDSVTTIEQNAFVGCCTTIEKLIIGKGVTNIGAQALANCVIRILELKSTTPPTIGENAFMASGINKIIVPTEAYEAYKTAWSDYATLIDCLVYQSDLDVLEEKITEKITENREEINKDIKNLYAITAQGGLYTMLEVEQAFSSRETADGESIVDGQYTAPTKIQGDTVSCKNLFDVSKVTNTSSLTNNGETLTVTAASATNETLKELCPTLNAGDVVVISFNTTSSDVDFIMFSSLVRTWSNGQSITIDENMLNDTLTFYHNVSSGASAVISNIQIEYGTTATDYVPYFTGLKNAYFKGIKSTGKNLFDISKLRSTSNGSVINNGDGSVTVNTYSSTAPTRLYETCPSLKAGDLVTLSFNSSSVVDGEKFIYLTDDTAHVSERWMEGQSKLLTENMVNARITFYTNPKDKQTPVTLTDIQIEYGTTATAYEPYKEDTYELSEAVELGKWDYIDVENKKVVRKTYQLTVNGDGAGQYKAQIIMYQDSTTGVWSILCPFHGNEGGRAMTAGRDGAVVSQNNICKYASITGGAVDIGYTTLQLVGVSVTTVEEAKALLAANPITFAYETFANTKTTVLEETPERYQAWENGSETVLQGDTDNSEYGAIPTVTTEYFKLTEV